jgi:hypothetical protein
MQMNQSKAAECEEKKKIEPNQLQNRGGMT